MLATAALVPTALRVPPATAGTDLSLVGHGYGHGRGMGQYGALGYAINASVSYVTILDHFYGGTSTATQAADAPMTVRMTAVDGLPTAVAQERGHLRTTLDGVEHFAMKVERTVAGVFRVYDAPGCGGPWTLRPGVFNGTTIEFTTSVVDDDRQNMLQLCEPAGTRWLRGSIRAVDADGTQRTVNALGTDAYLRGTVPRESPASWGDLNGGKGMQALKAQTVAARSYATAESRYSYAKTCDTISCQVYKGRAEQTSTGFRDLEDPRTDTAIAQTAGEVRTLSGAVARTEYSSSTGGYTAGGTFPPVPDDGDSVAQNPYHTWTQTVTAGAIESRYQRGTFRSATVLERNGLGEDGGRVLRLRLTFSDGTLDVAGSDFQSAFGLKSTWFKFSIEGPIFATFENLGGTLKSAPAAASWGPNRLDLFVRGADDALWHKWWDGAWRGWERLGGTLTSGPAATSSGNGLLDVFARGTDNGLWHLRWNGRAWSDWESLSGGLSDSPAATATNGHIYVFAPGTDNGVWFRDYDATTGWRWWQPLLGKTNAGPAATSWPDGRLDVFVTGTDNALWTNTFSGGRWGGWGTLGGVLTGGPGAAAWGPDRLDVFGRGSDNALWHRWFDAGAWSGWTRRGGGLSSGPAAASWSVGRLDVVVRGTDNALWHTWANS